MRNTVDKNDWNLDFNIRAIQIEWFLFNAKSAIFQLFQEQVICLNGMTMSALNKTNTFCLILIVLAHWSCSPRVSMSPHSDTLSRFRAIQSLRFLLKVACLQFLDENCRVRNYCLHLSCQLSMKLVNGTFFSSVKHSPPLPPPTHTQNKNRNTRVFILVNRNTKMGP